MRIEKIQSMESRARRGQGELGLAVVVHGVGQEAAEARGDHRAAPGPGPAGAAPDASPGLRCSNPLFYAWSSDRKLDMEISNC